VGIRPGILPKNYVNSDFRLPTSGIFFTRAAQKGCPWIQFRTRSNAASHTRIALGAFFIFVISSLIAAGGLFSYAPNIVQMLHEGVGERFIVANLLIITLPAITFFWVLRFLARVFVTNLQRLEDARERTTVVQTYLSLIAEGDKIIRRRQGMWSGGSGIDGDGGGVPCEAVCRSKELTSPRL
jgi:hypothetical protein